MNIIPTETYKKAFAAYLRSGAPILCSLKEAGFTDQYVWQSQDDGRVRPAHRMNDGRIFSWSDPPETGHPGTGYNCRCVAVPYIAGKTEFAFHEFSTSLASSYDEWTNSDFVAHYYRGAGRSVDLLELGHLRRIAEQFAYGDGAEGAFRRLTDQIADKAREEGVGLLHYGFSNSYDFGDVAFSHGDSVVSGVFVGKVEAQGAMLRITGETQFEFHDFFEDPLDIGLEAGGTPYAITGSWTARFEAEVFKDATASHFGQGGDP